MSLCGLRSYFYLWLLLWFASRTAMAASDLSELERLGRSNEWIRILYYVPRWTFQSTGLIDTPGFYLAKNGISDPVAELTATIAALEAPSPADPNQHAACLFPRRLKFLSAQLKSRRLNVTTVDCKGYREWREAFPVTGASLVFSSNYLNNPSSMYGHTFLRLHRKTEGGADPAPLLDYAINFAANPTTENPILYPVLGLTGRFFGTFSLMPYYMKVQEYNNAESRDLWEFPLELNDDETDSLMASLWEVGPHGIRYWYFDENCSFVLLGTIAAAKPSATAIDEFPNVVSPKDTITELISYGALGTPVRRLSALSRLNGRRAQLNSREKSLLLKQTGVDHLDPELLALPPERLALVLDAVIEWISFREKLAGNRESLKYRALWTEALKTRANIGIASKPLGGDIDIPSRPEIGHPAQRVSLGVRAADRISVETTVGMRFTLHDTLSPSAGYSRDQEISMGDFQAAVRKADDSAVKIYPERATLVRILSVPTLDLITRSFAWTLTLGGDRMYGPGEATWFGYRFEAGAGAAYDLTPSLKLFAMPIVEAGLLTRGDTGLDSGIGARSGILWDASNSLRLGATGDLDVIRGAAPLFRTWSYRGFVSKDLGTLWEMRVEWTRRAYRSDTAMLTLFRYF